MAFPQSDCAKPSPEFRSELKFIAPNKMSGLPRWRGAEQMETLTGVIIMDNTDLIERLGEIESDPIGCGLSRNSYRNPDGPDAIKEIQDLRAINAELLEACERLALFHESCGHEGNADSAIEAAKAAIAKAKGGT